MKNSFKSSKAFETGLLVSKSHTFQQLETFMQIWHRKKIVKYTKKDVVVVKHHVEDEVQNGTHGTCSPFQP